MGGVARRLRRAALALVLGPGLLAACGEADTPDDAVDSIRPPEIARIATAQAALEGAHVPTLDPGTMNDAEIRKAIGSGPRCGFRYTSAGRPVLAVDMRPESATRGAVVKLNGSLVLLDEPPMELASTGGAAERGDVLSLAAGPIRIAVFPVPAAPDGFAAGLPRREATMTFEVGDRLRAGYRGYLDCGPGSPWE